MACQVRVTNETGRTKAGVGSFMIGARGIGTAWSCFPFIAFHNVDTEGDTMAVKGGSISPMTILDITATTIHVIIDFMVDTITSWEGAWLWIEIVALVKIIHTIWSSPTLLASTKFFSNRLVKHADTSRRFA